MPSAGICPGRFPTDEGLRALLHKIIARLMKRLTRRGVLIDEKEGGSRYLADAKVDSDEGRAPSRMYLRCEARWC